MSRLAIIRPPASPTHGLEIHYYEAHMYFPTVTVNIYNEVLNNESIGLHSHCVRWFQTLSWTTNLLDQCHSSTTGRFICSSCAVSSGPQDYSHEQTRKKQQQQKPTGNRVINSFALGVALQTVQRTEDHSTSVLFLTFFVNPTATFNSCNSPSSNRINDRPLRPK